MAVPKNKRYKQIVRSRRFYQKNKLINKKGLIFSKFNNYLLDLSYLHFFNKSVNNDIIIFYKKYNISIALKYFNVNILKDASNFINHNSLILYKIRFKGFLLNKTLKEI
jgi:hypothetical protein